jgi:apolipoprotein N-acyltransferase
VSAEQQSTSPATARGAGNGMGVAGFVTGLVGLSMWWLTPIVGIVLGILGVVLGALAVVVAILIAAAVSTTT